MVCYRCKREALELAPLWPYEREMYARIEIVMRLCLHCGLEQNHYGHDEILTPAEAAYKATPAFVPSGHSWTPQVSTREESEDIVGDLLNSVQGE